MAASLSVSLCVPTWEPGAAHLGALLASIRAQALDDLEVVVSDDASSTDVAGLVEEAAGGLEVRVVRQPRRLGMVANWNAAAALAGGDLMMVLGQDDELGPGMLAQYLRELAAHDHVVACSGGETLIDDAGRTVRPRRRPNQRHRIFRHAPRYELDQAELLRLCLRNGQVYGEPSAVMFRRATFEAIGGYRPEFGHVADIDLDLRLAGEGTVVYLVEPVLWRRLHGGMHTLAQQATGATATDRLRLHEAWIDHPSLTDADRARARVAIASWAARDAAKATLHRRWGVAREQAGVAVHHGRQSPRYVVEHALELVTARNRDER